MSDKLKWRGRHNQSTSGCYRVFISGASGDWCAYKTGATKWVQFGTFPTREAAKAACQAHADEAKGGA